MTDAEWFRQSIETLFGDGGQSAFARFMVLAGDRRKYETILRTIQNTAAGRHRMSGEMRCLLSVMMRPGGVKRMVRDAVNPAYTAKRGDRPLVTLSAFAQAPSVKYSLSGRMLIVPHWLQHWLLRITIPPHSKQRGRAVVGFGSVIAVIPRDHWWRNGLWTGKKRPIIADMR